MSTDAALTISSPDVETDDLLHWRAAFATVFGMSPPDTAGIEMVRETYRSHRLTGCRDDGRWVATFRHWRADSAVPGGVLPSELVSSVSVAPTHRRRGILRTLMTDALRHAHESGAVLATLFASEAPIYGRFGYGVATHAHDLVVDTRAVGAWHAGAPADPGRVRLSDDDELLEVGPRLFDAARRTMPGAVDRNSQAWQYQLERMPHQKPEGARVRAVHLGASGEVDGYVRVQVHEKWEHGTAQYRASVDDLTGTDPLVVAALWRFALGLDLVAELTARHRGHGELLPHLPVDSRAVRTTSADGHWWRVLDTPAALAGRRWSAPGRVVLQVVDPDGPAAGTWLLDADEHGRAEVTPTEQQPDVRLPVQSLPPVLTGVLDLAPLHAVGRIDELSPDAVAVLGRMSHAQTVGLAPYQGF